MLIVVTTMSISSSDFVTRGMIVMRDRKIPMYTKTPTLPFKYFQVFSVTFKYFQVLSGTFRFFQVLSGYKIQI